MRDELDEAYRRAIYRVHLPAGDLDVRVGEPAPELDRFLASLGATSWAWLTAFNPGSVRLPEAENRRRLARLRAELERPGWTVLDGVALDPDGLWPDEPSFLVAGATLAAARGLAAAHAQNAFLAGVVGGPVELVGVAGRDREGAP